MRIVKTKVYTLPFPVLSEGMASLHQFVATSKMDHTVICHEVTFCTGRVNINITQSCRVDRLAKVGGGGCCFFFYSCLQQFIYKDKSTFTATVALRLQKQIQSVRTKQGSNESASDPCIKTSAVWRQASACQSFIFMLYTYTPRSKSVKSNLHATFVQMLQRNNNKRKSITDYHYAKLKGRS